MSGHSQLLLVLAVVALAAGTPRIHQGSGKEPAANGQAANVVAVAPPPALRSNKDLIAVTHLFLSILLLFYSFGV